MSLRSKKSFAVSAFMLAIATVLAYLGTLQSPFLESEVRTILDNPVIQDFSKVNDIVRVDQIFNGSLPKLSLSINHLAGHRSPWGYHLVNLLIHLGVGLALYWVVGEWVSIFCGREESFLKWLPPVTAAIHLLHPLNTQAVILISSRPILLASLFYILTFGFLARFLRVYRENPNQAKGSIDFLMVMACLAVGGTCHPVMVTLPFMAWIFYRLYASKTKIEGEIFALTLIPWVIYLIYQFTTPDPLLVAEAGRTGSLPGLYILTQIKALVFYYLPKALFPMHLNLDPDFRLVSGFGDWTWMLALVILGALFALVRAIRSSLTQWAFLWTLLIFTSFYGVGMDDPVVTEPRFYLPGIGIHLIVALALVRLGQRHPIAGWLRFGIPVLFLALTFGRGQDYRSESTLWETTAQASPHKPRVHYELGRVYLKDGFPDKAEKSLATTLQLDPKHVPARIKMAEIHIKREEYAKALEAYEELTRQGIKNPMVSYHSGLALLAMGEPEKALPFLEKAVEDAPGSAEWHLTLARAYHKSRQLGKALKHYRATLAIHPEQPVAHNEMGMVFWDMKSFYFADVSFQQAYQLDRQYVGALNNLVTSSLMFRLYDEAIAYLDRLLEINPEDTNAQQMMDAARRLKEQAKLEPPAPAQSFH
ncbi:MAG: tetratricopeptide repeat protein [Nitrospinota bacterium]|nr:tetratricopeptide repeat protein [Nitrospinota bacterium]